MNKYLRKLTCRTLLRSEVTSYTHVRKVRLSTSKSPDKVILGIETSCDDTGCAVIDDKGNLLGESLYSQHLVHIKYGGIIPDIAQDLHREHIEPAVNEALYKAGVELKNLQAIAVTNQPGLPLSLLIGIKYARHLARQQNIPLIPIHHMEAHALIPRMEHNIEFPYLVLLISGGHSLLAVAQDVNKFVLLGEALDIAPGEVFDKIHRRMKLRNIPELSALSGGQAIEVAASKAKNPTLFEFPLPLAEYRDCNFSFNGLKTSCITKILRKEREHNLTGDEIIPEANDFCAAFQMSVCKHLVHRTQRAMEFCQIKNLLPGPRKQLVVSGGVACNNFIFRALKILTDEMNYELYRPSPKLCTDNGVMIAWNGLEKWRKGIGILKDIDSMYFRASSPLGTSLIAEVVSAKLPVKVIKLGGLFKT